MMSRVGRHVRSNAVGYAALFVALGGSAYAAMSLPANSVGRKQLRAGAVTGKKVARHTLTGRNLAAGAVGSAQLAAGAVGNVQLAAGAVTNDKLANSSVTVAAGTGLKGGGAAPLGGSTTLSVDPSAVQSRVTGSCSPGNAISSIAQGGTVGCQPTSPFQPDTGQSLVASVAIDVIGAGMGSAVPFVTTPDGSTIVGSPCSLGMVGLCTRSIVVTNPEFGMYSVGMQESAGGPLLAASASVTASRDASTTTFDMSGVPTASAGPAQAAGAYTYSPDLLSG